MHVFLIFYYLKEHLELFHLDLEVISDFDNDIINVPSLSIAKKEKNIDDVISKIQKVVEEVKELGFEAKLEEYDFDGLYQFVIKVDNEN